MSIKAFILAAAILGPSPDIGNQSISWCDVATPIYVQSDDYNHLQSTDHGMQLLDWIETHNQKIIDLCEDLPRTLHK